MIIKKYDAARKFLSKKDLDFYDECREKLSKNAWSVLEREAMEKARAEQGRQQLFFSVGEIFCDKFNCGDIETAKKMIEVFDEKNKKSIE